MKVLMFGWEFPPHISGGLGTACHGLTEALISHGIDILFVVPTLKGGESIHNGNIISASEIIIPTDDAPHGGVAKRTEIRRQRRKTKTIPGSTYYEEELVTVPVKATTSSIEYLNVPSRLMPYQSATVNDVQSVTRWNQTFQEEYTVSKIFRESDFHTEENEPYVVVKEGYTYNLSGTYGPSLMQDVKTYSVVARTIAKENSFDAIHAHDWMTFPAAMEAKKVSGKPLVVHIHATEYDRAGENGNPAVYEIEREAMAFADYVLAVSQRTKDIAIERYNIPPEKVEVVHNGISPVVRSAASFSTPLGSHIITFLGRITFQKGPMFFVEAARKVLLKFPEAHFIVAGSGDLLPQMVERVAQLRISMNFHFTGFVKGNDIDKIWAVSDAYVMPSVSEPFGITPLEAIQAGVPVIISNQAGVSEVMPHAMKVDFWNTDALADAICSVLKYGSLSGMLKKNSNEEIKKITWSKAAKKIKHIYDELD